MFWIRLARGKLTNSISVQVLNTATFYSASKGSLSGFVPSKETAPTVLLGDNTSVCLLLFLPQFVV
jgi:hypothetical protein